MSNNVQCPKCGGYKVESRSIAFGCLALFLGIILAVAGLVCMVTGDMKVGRSVTILVIGVALIAIYWIWARYGNPEYRCTLCGYRWLRDSEPPLRK